VIANPRGRLGYGFVGFSCK